MYTNKTPHVVIIESRSYNEVSEELFRGAVMELENHGVAHSRVTVPQMLDLAGALRAIIEATKEGAMVSSDWRKPDGFIVVGTIIRSEIGCADLLYQEALRALQDLACYYTLPVSYGIVISNTIEQAKSVSSPNGGNRGGEAAQSCLALMDLKRKLGLASGAIAP